MKIIRATSFLFLPILLLLAGCGYRWGQGSVVSSYQTISIPYVEGDEDGSLTAAIIKQISQSGTLRYCDSGGSLSLRVKLVDTNDENVSFRYDHKKDGRLSRSVIPDETRITAEVEVAVVESVSGKTIMGPVRLFADVDFDHDYYSSRHGINVFSLGQLTDYDEAYDAAQSPLNKRIAQKIVDFMNANG